MDNRLILLVRDIDASDRWTEKLVFDTIAKLAPRLRDIPIEGERWRFERTEPSAPSQSELTRTWSLRPAMRATDVMNKFDWRRLQNAQIRSLITGLILDNVDSSDKVFDRKKLESYLSAAKYPTTVWHILTSVLFRRGHWEANARQPKTEPIEIITE